MALDKRMLKKICRSSVGLLLAATSVAGLLVGCESKQDEATEIPLKAFWLYDIDGEILRDPQTSGLVSWRNNTLVSVADGSAHESQVLKLLQVDPVAKRIVKKIPFAMSESLAKSCFADFLSERPDLEALVVDPSDDSIFYIVTEDASDYQLSATCQQQFGETGSTEFPTLLLRIKLSVDGNSAQITHARALQYSAEMNIGNFPNDGIEGMTFGLNGQLYLALEKDENYHARIFSVTINEEFWTSDEFAPVTDLALDIPVFGDKKPHPINALTYVNYQGNDWLLAAARNDNQLWLIDVNGKRETQVMSLTFHAEIKDGEGCPAFELMDNYSMEGMAVADDTLWLVNDPWKHNYLKNLQCPANKANYEKMAPLLTSIKLEDLFLKIQP